MPCCWWVLVLFNCPCARAKFSYGQADSICETSVLKLVTLNEVLRGCTLFTDLNERVVEAFQLYTS